MQFSGPKWPICPQIIIYSEKPLIQLSCASWPLSFCKIFKKFLELIQSCKNTSFLLQIAPKMAHFLQNRIFSEKVTTYF